MKKFKITIKEEFVSNVHIEANNEEEALKLAMNLYRDGSLYLKDIILKNTEFYTMKDNVL